MFCDHTTDRGLESAGAWIGVCAKSSYGTRTDGDCKVLEGCCMVTLGSCMCLWVLMFCTKDHTPVLKHYIAAVIGSRGFDIGKRAVCGQ